MAKAGDVVTFHFKPTSEADFARRPATVVASYEDGGSAFVDLDVQFSEEDCNAFGIRDGDGELMPIPPRQTGVRQAPNNQPPDDLSLSGTWTSP